jgi:hypothetical protein
MNKPKLLKIVMWVLTPLLFVLVFEWYNVESYYKDMVETGDFLIKERTDITIKQKAIYLKENDELGLKMRNEILIIKCLMIIFTLGLFLDFYLLSKIEEKRPPLLGEI